MTILARLVSVLMGAGLVVVAYRTAAVLWDWITGSIAGLFVLLLYPMFYYSRTSNVDVPALFWTSLGILVFCLSLTETLTARRAILLGMFAALAIATKDASYAAFLPLALVIAPVEIRRQRREGKAWRQAVQNLSLALASSILTYVIASGLIFSFERFGQHVRFVTQGSEAGRPVFYYSTPATLAGYVSILGEVVTLLVDSLGIVMALAVAAGLYLCWRRPSARRNLVLTLPAIGVLLLVILPVRFVLLRFVLIMAYVLALMAAYGISSLLRLPDSAYRRVGRALLIVVIVLGIVRGGDLTFQMLFDSRYALGDWLAEHARAGDTVGYYGASLKLPALEAGITTVPMPGQIIPVPSEVPDSFTPEFIVIIPQQPFEPVHSWTLAESDYTDLVNGNIGYLKAAEFQSRTLFSRHPISFVNPPVQVFVRRDLVARLSQ